MRSLRNNPVSRHYFIWARAVLALTEAAWKLWGEVDIQNYLGYLPQRGHLAVQREHLTSSNMVHIVRFLPRKDNMQEHHNQNTCL
ncbi:hypothetical protein chiPu_0008210 [Chiloscyllium punctatum]|uniref:Uncharacterized protein n=1 Tax=Chiloscyllium punctatum TaxID=137246 RepID=A0A401SH93_CHIPU|nr:hypothetical protein [Chiloscyllium punctatum]